MRTVIHKVLPTILVVVLCSISPAQSEVTVRRDGDFTIQMFITGTISLEDVEIIRKASGSGFKQKIRMVLLSSLGGSVDAAIAIGETLRDGLFYTTVKRGSKCASACVLILAAGVNRDVENGGIVAVHRPTFEPSYFAGLSLSQSRSKYDQLVKNIRDYLSRMGMSDRLFELMMLVSSHEIRTLSTQELRAFGLIGLDPMYEERRRAEDIVEYGAEYVKRRDDYFSRMQTWGELCMSAGKSQWQCMIEYERIEPYPQP